MADRWRDRAMAQLVQDRAEALTRFAYLFTGDTAAAQDLVQDAVVKVFIRTRSGFTPDSLEGYVRRAIVTTYIDGHRRRRRWADVQHLFADAHPPEGPDAAAQLDLRAALGTLAPQERAAVVLRFFGDLTVTDVADEMGLAPGTVKRYLSNAITKLEERLGPVPEPRLDHDHVPVVTDPHRRKGG